MKKKNNTISIIVDNEPGVLSRVVGLFSAQGYNIDSLNVDTANIEDTLSRITITTAVTEIEAKQMISKVEKIIPVHSAKELHEENGFYSELAYIKTKDTENAHSIADKYDAIQIDKTDGLVIFKLIDDHHIISKFGEELETDFVETARSGLVAIEKGNNALIAE
ncbi:MAG: acetolactate synthase small subunit [Alphaproteobacteria bacterium]|nr:acetolactate synthase small subunit [Alphaproteobacteria bacterium]